ALSPGMKEGVVRTGYPSQQVATIPNSSDNQDFIIEPSKAEEFRASRRWLQDKPLLVYVGTFGLINGVGYMVWLSKELLALNPDIRILLVVEDIEKPLVKQQAQEVGVLDVNLFVEDSLPKKDIPALLAAADMASSLFIDKPVMRPNSANKFFDALAAGKPVFLNYGGWQHELVQAKACGLRSEEHTSELQSRFDLVCRLLLE